MHVLMHEHRGGERETDSQRQSVEMALHMLGSLHIARRPENH